MVKSLPGVSNGPNRGAAAFFTPTDEAFGNGTLLGSGELNVSAVIKLACLNVIYFKPHLLHFAGVIPRGHSFEGNLST